MNNKIVNDLELAVKNNISDVEMGVFKREFERLQGIEVEYVNLRDVHNRLKSTHKELVSEYELEKLKIDIILSRENDLTEREKEIKTQETQLYIDQQLVSMERNHSNNRVDDHKNMVNQVFRSPVFTKTVIESGTRAVVTPVNKDEHGNMIYPTVDNVDENKKTVTETKEE